MRIQAFILAVSGLVGFVAAQYQPPPGGNWSNACSYTVTEIGFSGVCEGDEVGNNKCTNCGNSYSDPSVRCVEVYVWSCGTVGTNHHGNHCHLCTPTHP